MDIQRIGSRPSGRGLASWFDAAVRVEPLYGAHVPGRAGGVSVTFGPGARSAWHLDLEQLGRPLIVASGLGWAQREGGQDEEIRHCATLDITTT